MASSSEDPPSQSKAADPAAAHPPPSSSPNNPPPIYPPPTMGYPPAPHPGYPPAMGYPPAAPHPGYSSPPNYPAYPQNGYNGGYAYAQAPPAAYYNNQTYQVERINAGFVRGIFSALILLVVLMTLSSIITWMILRPEIPIFKVDSFSVTNLNLAKSNYSGLWEANVTVENSNRKLNVHFDRIQSFVDYKDHTLAMSFVDPFFLDVQKSNQMHVKLTSNSPDDPGDWSEVTEKIGQERATGLVSFNLRFFAWSTFRSGTWWTRHVIMRVFCEDLKVGFAGTAAANGKFLADGHPKACLVYV